MSHFHPLRTLAVAVATTVGLLVAGCAGPDPGAAGATGATVDDNRPADPTAEITAAQFGTPTTLDPHRSRSPLSDPGFLSPLYDQLLRLDPGFGIQPMLASAYEMAPDGTSITLTLRDDVRFQDGSGFDSAVVAANLQRARTLPESTAAPLLRTVAGIETPDPGTVRIVFSEPNQTFPYLLASNFGLSSMISGQAIAAGTDLNRAAAGSGPYRLAELGQDRVVVERDDAYWDVENLPEIARVTLIGMPDDNARLSALQSGQVQVAAFRPNQSPSYQDLLSSGQFQSHSFSGQVYGLYVNTGNPALSDPRVRRAISMGIDRDAINQALFNGRGQPAYQFYPEGMPGFLADQEVSPYDPEAARALLAEAGQSDLSFSTIMSSTEPGDSIGTIVQAQLAEIGVTLELQRYAPTESRPAWRQGGSDMFASAFQVGGDPSVFLREAVLGPDDPGGAPPQVTAAAGTALGLSLTDPQRAAAFEDITTLLAEQPLHILTVRVPLQYIATPDVLHLRDMTFAQLGSMIDVRALAVAAGGTA